MPADTFDLRLSSFMVICGGRDQQKKTMVLNPSASEKTDLANFPRSRFASFELPHRLNEKNCDYFDEP